MPNWIEASSLHKEVDFQVSLFQFEKGEYIPHHDHPDMTGVINVVSGNLLTKNYSIEEKFSTTREVVKNGRKEVLRKCVIREVENEIVERGDVSILTAHEGNIHSIMPNELTQLVDVFTPAYKPDTNANWYKVSEDGFYMGRENIFEVEYVIKGLSQVDTIKLSREKLNRYVGSYKVNDKKILKIFTRSKEIILESTRSLDTPGRKMNLLPYEENKFWVEGNDIRCVINLDNKKIPERLTLYIDIITTITANKIK